MAPSGPRRLAPRIKCWLPRAYRGPPRTRNAGRRASARQAILYTCVADTTVLRRVVRRDRDQLATSICRFVRQHLSQLSPRGVRDGPRQCVVPYHIRRAKVFQGNHLVAVDIRPADLVQRVLPLMDDPLMVAGHHALGLASSDTPLRASRQPSLGLAQRLSTALEILGVLDLPPGAVSHQIGDPHVQAHSVCLDRKRRGHGLADALQIPARRPHNEARILERTLERPVDVDPDLAPTLARRVEVVALQGMLCVSQLNGVPTIPPLEPREADSTSFPASSEEVGTRTMETLERGIDHDGWQVGMFGLPVLCILFVQMQMFASGLVGGD